MMTFVLSAHESAYCQSFSEYTVWTLETIDGKMTFNKDNELLEDD